MYYSLDYASDGQWIVSGRLNSSPEINMFSKQASVLNWTSEVSEQIEINDSHARLRVRGLLFTEFLVEGVCRFNLGNPAPINSFPAIDTCTQTIQHANTISCKSDNYFVNCHPSDTAL